VTEDRRNLKSKTRGRKKENRQEEKKIDRRET